MTTIENRQRWGNFLLILAWILVVIEVLISSMIGWSFGYQTYELYVQEYGSISFNYFDLILAGLPFLMVAAVCLTVIPICHRIYTRDIKVKIIFSVVLLGVTTLTFETLVVGFERQFNNISKSVVISQGKLDAVLEDIQLNNERIEKLERVSIESISTEVSIRRLEAEAKENFEKDIQIMRSQLLTIKTVLEDGMPVSFEKDLAEIVEQKNYIIDPVDPSYDKEKIEKILYKKISDREEEYIDEIKEIDKYRQSQLDQLAQNDEIKYELKITLTNLEKEKIGLQQELYEAYKDTQIYRIAQSVYDLEEDEYISKAQIATVVKFWFGSLGGIIVLIPILLAFGAFRIKNNVDSS